MNFSKLKDFLDYMAANRTPGCTASVYVDNKPVFKYSAGVSDLASGTPMTGDEYFNIYSCSKVTTVTAAAQLLEKGVFLLTDPLYEFIPEYRHMSIQTPDGLVEAKNPITVGDLFSMSAGFSYNFNCPSVEKARELTGGKMDTAVVARCLAGEPLLYEPGTRWRYSLGHDVLAGLVAILTGMTFREYVQKNIFDPLDMKQSTYHADDAVKAKMATQYRFQPPEGGTQDIVEAQKSGTGNNGTFLDVGKNVSHILGSEYDSGGAGITTTVDDYAKLASALACGGLGATGERILGAETVELMKVNRLNETQLADFNWKQLVGYGYGMGVRTHINKAKSGSIARLGEFGWGGAAGATIIMDTELKMGVFFAQHTLNPREEWYQPRLKNVAYACME